MAAEQFVPPGQPESTKSCGGNITGSKKTNSQYIAYAGTDDTSYPGDACGRLVHGNAQIDNLQVNETCTATNFQGTINVQAWKGFDIKHPNKENHRLRHICLEGPEAGVYIRGKLIDSNVIDLPDYWRGLIDPESITVSLTQIGSSQDLIVDKIEWGNKVHIKSGNASAINCFYTIHASRIDGEPLIVEYEGETPAEYPGSPRQFSISGYDYDARG
tara:strand:- start:64 stop:711 length:648 start_codon:yes stop_codon:yes gene_type:complete